MVRKTAMTMSSTPMANDPTPSQRPSPVTSASVTPSSANTRPTSAPASSSSTTGSSGWRASRTNRNSERSPRERFASRSAVRNEKPSSTIARMSTPYAHCGEVSGSGCWILWTPS